jgi:hypothetical protein
METKSLLMLKMQKIHLKNKTFERDVLLVSVARRTSYPKFGVGRKYHCKKTLKEEYL